MLSRLILGLDLGRRRNPSALVVLDQTTLFTGRRDPATLERETVSCLAVRHAQQIALGTPYHDIPGRIQRLLQTPNLPPAEALVLDATGVGAAVLEIFERAALRLPLVPILITSGHDVHSISGGGFSVPRHHLLDHLAVLFEAGGIKLASDLPLFTELSEEINRLHPDTRQDPDDLAFALALAAWYAARHQPRRPQRRLPGF
jgi:hypothetical protein